MVAGAVDERKHASISEDGLYRYELERYWGRGPCVLFVMLNPSTADADRDDPTIRRCRGFAKTWGHAGFGVVNLFALRSPKPEALIGHPDPVGPNNEAVIRRWLRWSEVSLVVAAWGAGIPGDLPHQEEHLRTLAAEYRRPLYCLGKTKDGYPRHPLLVRGDKELELWP